MTSSQIELDRVPWVDQALLKQAENLEKKAQAKVEVQVAINGFRGAGMKKIKLQMRELNSGN